MKILTDYMGEIEFTEDEIIEMPKGFYGFPNSRKFILIGELSTEFPFVWFQSIEEKDVSFILTDPFLFIDDYNFEIGDDVTANLGINKVEEVKVFTTVIIKENISESTINLKSPIIFNVESRKVEQVVLDADYPYKYKIFTKKVVN